MPVMSVSGWLDDDELGVISPHEHVLINLVNQFTEFEAASKRTLSEEPVQMSNLGALARNPYAVRDNLILGDVNVAMDELRHFHGAGGDTMVDATSIGIGPDPEALRYISRNTGVNIIAGCGYYYADTHPADMDERTIDQLTAEILTGLNDGLYGTQIRAGVIGEIGTSPVAHPNEVKVLIASANAYAETGVGIIVHTYPWGQEGLKVVDVLTKHGVPPHKININHIDVEIDMDYCRKLADTGAMLEFDNFGKEFYIEKRYRGFAGGVFARDIERVRVIKTLIEAGYLSNILLACDVCLKNLLRTYGGWGYDHVLTNIVPMMLDEGISQAQIDTMLRDNPKRFLI